MLEQGACVRFAQLAPEDDEGRSPAFRLADQSACEWVGREGQVQLDRLGLAKE